MQEASGRDNQEAVKEHRSLHELYKENIVQDIKQQITVLCSEVVNSSPVFQPDTSMERYARVVASYVDTSVVPNARVVASHVDTSVVPIRAEVLEDGTIEVELSTEDVFRIQHRDHVERITQA